MNATVSPELGQRLLSFARRVFADMDWRDEEGDFLPIWHHTRGHLIGSGDYPRTFSNKGTAKRICVNQLRRDGTSAEGYIAERRDEQIYLYSAGAWVNGRYQSDPNCWRKPLLGERLDGTPAWDVPIQSGAPRSRPSDLSERQLVCA